MTNVTTYQKSNRIEATFQKNKKDPLKNVHGIIYIIMYSRVFLKDSSKFDCVNKLKKHFLRLTLHLIWKKK